MSTLKIADKEFKSRLFTGTGKFSSSELMEQSLLATGSELVTVALKRVDVKNEKDDILTHLNHSHINLLRYFFCIQFIWSKRNSYTFHISLESYNYFYVWGIISIKEGFLLNCVNVR